VKNLNLLSLGITKGLHQINGQSQGQWMELIKLNKQSLCTFDQSINSN